MPNSHHSATLIIGPSWVGDMVMAQSLFKVLKQQSPERAIDVLAPAWSLPLLERMPEVRNAICQPVGHGKLALGVRYQLAKSLRKTAYQQALVLPNSLKSALIPFWANIPQRRGYVGELRYFLLNQARKLDKNELTRTVDRFVALALPENAPLPKPLPIPALQISPAAVQRALNSFGLQQDKPILALCPGAEYGPAKCWPPEHFAEVAQHQLEQGWQIWLFGSEKDRATAETINQLTGGSCQNLCGKTSLAQAIDLLSIAHSVISNDSGLMHVAAALNRPLVALYGSSDPGFTPPLSENAHILSLDLDCSPCFKRQCPLGHLACLSDILPQDVSRLI
ncbi:lipopolysaccharide heptosyltransferase II [Candidatus Venteria ishoeyi]|uniref:lipopolysaccharide heptosyltransferase II n=1 Tax=Candidatus Venteria ishoeyi TaxID=1899563 RepID=UPI0025A53A5B|nr:lipopolysaccharide heptosyltransferase II [Candidatus Venteria ishoeyi]MDM8547007.1 lipopolysaccharide heptosyltransferase II [Candidatus Venteria ishoeyi]